MRHGNLQTGSAVEAIQSRKRARWVLTRIRPPFGQWTRTYLDRFVPPPTFDPLGITKLRKFTLEKEGT